MSRAVAFVTGLALLTLGASSARAQTEFADSASYPAGDLAGALAVADLDGDGVLDLVLGNVLTLDASLILGRGDGTFGVEQRLSGFGAQVHDVGVADFDGDGDLDLAFLLRHGPGLIALLRNDGTGGFGSPEFSGPGLGAFSLSIADLDGNGSPDIAVASMNVGVDLIAALLINDGRGNFMLDVHTLENTSTLYNADLDTGDVDGDGLTDIVGTNRLSGGVFLLRNAGGGSFDAPLPLTTGVLRPLAVALADLDGDGDEDLAFVESVSSGPELLVVARNDGSGSFERAGSSAIGNLNISITKPAALSVADIDRDGLADVVLSRRVMFNAGSATFDAPTLIETGGAALATLVRDLDGDGDLDIVQASNLGSVDGFAAVVLNVTPPDKSWVGRPAGGQRAGNLYP